MDSLNILRAWEITLQAKNDAKPYTDPHEQEMLLAPSISCGRGRTFRSTALEWDLWLRKFMRKSPNKAPCHPEPSQPWWSLGDNLICLCGLSNLDVWIIQRKPYILIPKCSQPCSLVLSLGMAYVETIPGDPPILLIDKKRFENKDWDCYDYWFFNSSIFIMRFWPPYSSSPYHCCYNSVVNLQSLLEFHQLSHYCPFPIPESDPGSTLDVVMSPWSPPISKYLWVLSLLRPQQDCNLQS